MDFYTSWPSTEVRICPCKCQAIIAQFLERKMKIFTSYNRINFASMALLKGARGPGDGKPRGEGGNQRGRGGGGGGRGQLSARGGTSKGGGGRGSSRGRGRGIPLQSSAGTFVGSVLWRQGHISMANFLFRSAFCKEAVCLGIYQSLPRKGIGGCRSICTTIEEERKQREYIALP